MSATGAPLNLPDKAPKSPKGGRPSKYTPELVAEICERMSQGEPLAAICRDEHMPGYWCVRDWEETVEGVKSAIARAREAGEDFLAAECLTIANTPCEGIETEEIEEGRVKTKKGDMLGHRKLQIETRLKLLAKWNPRKWGDRMEHSGSLVTTPPVINVTVQPPTPDDE
jgi:hypothetical protein